MFKKILLGLVLTGLISTAPAWAQQAPEDIAKIYAAPRYKNATWGLRVVDAASGEVLIDRTPEKLFYIGSVRKLFSVGLLLEAIGPKHTYDTAVFRQGEMKGGGVLAGNLVLLASGDLCVGGRTNPDGTLSVPDYDHNEADSLGNAILPGPDPLAGYRKLAQQVAASGIKQVKGDVVVDDRLFQPFNFRDQFNVTPMFVNDDVVDLSLSPGPVGARARIEVRPKSEALKVMESVLTGSAGTELKLELDPEVPEDIGTPGATARIKGTLPVDFKPLFTNAFPLIRNFRISSPSNYARSIFIEELRRAGVHVQTATVAPNPVEKLPARDSYAPDDKIATLVGDTYAELARYILKVSYNIGADTSLVLLGLTEGVDNMPAALEKERALLTSRYGIPADSFHFIDGSGGGETATKTVAVTDLLQKLLKSPNADTLLAALPVMAVDGSLGFVTDFKSDPSLVGAMGHVRAKPGTYMLATDKEAVVKGQAFGGVVDTRGGRRLIYVVVVNDVPVTGIEDLMSLFQDQGTVSAILWRDY